MFMCAEADIVSLDACCVGACQEPRHSKIRLQHSRSHALLVVDAKALGSAASHWPRQDLLATCLYSFAAPGRNASRRDWKCSWPFCSNGLVCLTLWYWGAFEPRSLSFIYHSLQRFGGIHLRELRLCQYGVSSSSQSRGAFTFAGHSLGVRVCFV